MTAGHSTAPAVSGKPTKPYPEFPRVRARILGVTLLLPSPPSTAIVFGSTVATNRAAWLGMLLEFLDMGDAFFQAGPATEVQAHPLEGPLRRFAPRPHADQQTQ
jgi:hypothetical protein